MGATSGGDVPHYLFMYYYVLLLVPCIRVVCCVAFETRETNFNKTLSRALSTTIDDVLKQHA